MTTRKKALLDVVHFFAPPCTPVPLARRDNITFSRDAAHYFSGLPPHSPLLETGYYDWQVDIRYCSDQDIRDDMSGWSNLLMQDAATVDACIGRLIDHGAIMKRAQYYVCYFKDPSNPKSLLYASVIGNLHRHYWEVQVGPARVQNWPRETHVLQEA